MRKKIVCLEGLTCLVVLDLSAKELVFGVGASLVRDNENWVRKKLGICEHNGNLTFAPKLSVSNIDTGSQKPSEWFADGS